MYIANSAFERGGVPYRPGDIIPALPDAAELIRVGYIVTVPGAEPPAETAQPEQAVPDEAPKEQPDEQAEADDTDVKKSGRKK